MGNQLIRRAASVVLVAALAAAGLTGCLAAAGDTTQIQKVSTITQDGWTWDFYRNTAYPCSFSGYQTFIVGRKVGSSDSDSRPLWVKMHGGGTGYFDAAGVARPNTERMDEETRGGLLGSVDAGLMANVQASDDGYRMLVVSMCSHDIYGGFNTPDPNNPNLTPEGNPRPTTGLAATKAAVQFVHDTYPTDDFFLHGGSAGSVGTFHVAWALQQQALAPTGIIPDASVLNQGFEQARADQEICTSAAYEQARLALVARLHPAVGNAQNQPHLLVERGALTVPIMHVWNEGDTNLCSATPMACPVGSSVVTLGAAECMHRPLTLAIEAQGPSSRSVNLAVCVEGGNTAVACDKHVVTNTATGVNTAPGGPSDYNSFILDWVDDRRTDD